MQDIYLQAFSAIMKHGIYSYKSGFIPWEAKQKSPLDVYRRQVFEKPLTQFGKLNPPDKLAFAAASLILKNYSAYQNVTTGISLGNRFGSLSTDLDYCRSLHSGFPSPALFAATLPSSPLGEIAITYKLKGPNRTVVDYHNAGFLALDNALRILTFDKATTMLVVIVSALDDAYQTSPLIPCPGKISNYSFAFMLTKDKVISGMNLRWQISSQTDTEEYLQTIDEEVYFSTLVKTLMKQDDYFGPFLLYGAKDWLQLKKE